MKLEVGQQVYLVTKWNADVFQSHYSEVTKVGRKYAYVTWQNREAKVDLKSRDLIISQYGIVGKCFLDMNDYDDYKKALAIQTFMTEDLVRKTKKKEALTLDQLKRIQDILNEKN